jgi:hypothetical protein
MRIRRRNTAWLTIIGVLTGIVVLSGTASAQVTVALVGLFLLAAAASLIEIRPQRLMNGVQQSPLTLMRMSAPAREAVERARRRTNYTPAGLTLLDVGLISLHSSSEGMVMRRSRSISLDDDGVRPYITLHIQADAADRNAVIRYEILDHNGQVQYVHEMKTYLRDGEMNILADHHLPLLDNEKLSGGEWDLRVSIDGTLVGLLSFTAAPSIRGRERYLRGAEGSTARLEDVERDDSPVTLEDLLRSRGQSDKR